MKLDKDALVEIVSIIQDGLSQMKDISQQLRDLDLEQSDDPQFLRLSDSYLELKGRNKSADV